MLDNHLACPIPDMREADPAVFDRICDQLAAAMVAPGSVDPIIVHARDTVFEAVRDGLNPDTVDALIVATLRGSAQEFLGAGVEHHTRRYARAHESTLREYFGIDFEPDHFDEDAAA